MELYREKERNKDFFDTCEGIRRDNRPNYVSVENIASGAVLKEAQSFYLNTEIYARIINKVRCGYLSGVKNSLKRQMYVEIHKRYIRIKRENPTFNAMDCARIIAEQKAPRFYISPRHAVNLYYRLLKNNPK